MITIGGDDDIRGPYSLQPMLVRVGSVIIFVASVDLLVFIPICIAALSFAGVGAPAVTAEGRFGPFVFLGAMLAVGVWVNCMWLDWLTGGALSLRSRSLVVFAMVLVSAAACVLMVLTHVGSIVAAGVFAFVFVAAVLGALLVKIGRAIGGAR